MDQAAQVAEKFAVRDTLDGDVMASRDGGAAPTIPPESGARAIRRRGPSPRWAVTSEFVHEGFRYRIVRRPVGPAVDVHLTSREDEVLSLALRGLTNREIANCLGVASSTVRVLLFRASSKFRQKTRTELLAAYARTRVLPSTP